MTVLEAVSHDFHLLRAGWEELSNQAVRQTPGNMQKHRASNLPSEDQSNEDLKKLRRLSSITSITSFGSGRSSFTSWIPFTRRRQTTDAINNASITAITRGKSDNGLLFTDQSENQEARRTPMRPISGNRNTSGHHARQPSKSSIPRSSTFSHLPISTESRQPSETRPLLPSPQKSTGALSRIPTPNFGDLSRTTERAKPAPMTPRRKTFLRPPRISSLQKSSTQPALPTIQGTPPSTGNLKKENTLVLMNNAKHDVSQASSATAGSSFKTLSDEDMWIRIEKSDSDAGADPRTSAQNVPSSTPRRALNVRKTDEPAGTFYLSPVGQPMQRGRSQPVLGTTSRSNLQLAQPGQNAFQHQSMQRLRPPTPSVTRILPPPGSVTNKKMRNSPSSSTLNDSTNSDYETGIPPHLTHLQISVAQPNSYWSGRLLALSDRLQSEHAASALLARRPGSTNSSTLSLASTLSSTSTNKPFSSCPSKPKLKPKPKTKPNHPCNPLDVDLGSDTDRLRAALTLLFAYCTSPAAVASLRDFQRAYAAATRQPSLASAIPVAKIEKVALEVGMLWDEEEWVRNSAGAKVGRGKKRKGFWVKRSGVDEVVERAGEEEVEGQGGKSGGMRGGTGGSGAGEGGRGRKFSFVERLMGKRRRIAS
ncbi:MAG: hypothetical protein M1822_006270 [Bathelium mastoideum]|nr:MAG: hypothetical protein M1822_006270 [Bathelium mastoideum]